MLPFTVLVVWHEDILIELVEIGGAPWVGELELRMTGGDDRRNFSSDVCPREASCSLSSSNVELLTTSSNVDLILLICVKIRSTSSLIEFLSFIRPDFSSNGRRSLEATRRTCSRERRLLTLFNAGDFFSIQCGGGQIWPPPCQIANFDPREVNFTFFPLKI